MIIGATWCGVSGTRYFFDVFPIGQLFKPTAGVFVQCKRIEPKGWTALLVDEAENLRDVLNARDIEGGRYIKAGRHTPSDSTHIATMAIEKYQDRQSVVADLRRALFAAS